MKIVAGRTLRVLDFDIETRPSTFWRPDRPSMEITAIGAAWTDQPFEVQTWLIRPVATEAEWIEQVTEMLNGFKALYDAADMVTGHYIRRFDLLQILAQQAEFGLPLLGEKLTEDTKNDLIRWGDIPKTQEHLAEMFGVSRPKIPMSQHKWRQANRLLTDGMAFAYERVTGDVLQHMELRYALRKAGVLGPPKVWRP